MRKGYVVVKENMKSLIHFFRVAKTQKGEGSEKAVDEMRMVYDATKSGSNNAVWKPLFTMPIVDFRLRAVEAGTFMMDCDGGYVSKFYVKLIFETSYSG